VRGFSQPHGGKHSSLSPVYIRFTGDSQPLSPFIPELPKLRAKRFLGITLSTAEKKTLQEADASERAETKEKAAQILSTNSLLAYESTKPRKASVKADILDFISSRGKRGATTEDVFDAEQFRGKRQSTIATRVSELHRDGKIVVLRTRATRYSGKQAAVFGIAS
jgi:hypothetical protein